MADTSETDGVENRDHETNTSRQASKHTGVSSSVSLASSLSKRVKMDGDDDGAPTSILTSPIHQKGEAYVDGEGVDGNRTSVITFDSSAESTPKKTVSKRSSAPSTPQAQGHDLSTVDMKMSWDGSVSGGSVKGETTDGETGYKVAFKARAGMLADPVKIAKEREKEERVRQARERLMEERRKKLEELREQQRIAQENREKQLEMRRRKIEDLRRRDSERRAAVEERRKMKEDIERARRESLLQKSEERVARYEAWKAGGRKGGRGHIFGFGSATPRDICQPFERPRRSSSHSALQRRSPNGSDMDSMRPQRRALSACSAVRRHCCVDYNRIGPHTSASAIVAGFQHQQRLAAISTVPSTPLPRSSMTASMPSPVRMRENKSSRKQRPASVASSMPSFVGGEPAKTPRSKSTERTGRGTVLGLISDRSKTRPIRKDEKAIKDKENNSEKAQKSVHKLDKIENEKESEKDGDKEVSDKKDKKTRVSLSFYDRLATPKYSKKDGDPTAKVEQPHKKDPTLIRVQFAGDDDGDQDGMVDMERSSIRDKPSMKEGSSKQHPSTAKDTSQGVTPVSGPTTPIAPASRGISPGRKEKSASSTPRITPPSSSTSTPTHTPSVPRPSSPPVQAPVASDDGAPRIAPAPAQDITAEEYKARLAEKRRQAREKAEKEAEEERRRQEEARLAEEERLKKEEEEQRRLEEEAAEARRLEEERLKKAIEAEEKRKKEEADKMEVEKKAKEEADKKAREEAEKLEKEKQEKARREEEERQARKKKLEMIMKRVKPESQTESTLKIESPKSVSSSPNISQVNSSQNSPDEHDKPVAVASESPSEEDILPPVGSAVEILSAAMTTSFILDTDEDTSSTSTVMTASFIRSASSNDILDSQEVAEEHDSRLSSSAATTPSRHEDQGLSSESTSETKSKFKSPLLQQLVEKKALDSTSTSGPKFKSPLLQNLLGKTKVGARIGMSSSTGDLSHKEPGNGESSMSSSASLHTSQSSFTKELFNQDRDDEDKDEDTSVHDQTGTLRSFQMSHTSLTNGVSKESAFTKSSTDSSPAEAGGKFAVSNMSDSALGSSIEPHMDREFSAPSMMSQSFIWNGQEDVESQGMEDSSISLHSIAESLTTSGFVFDSVPQSDVTAEDDRHFEDLLDLRDSKTSSIVSGAPILAFGENRRQDATESLS